MKNKMSRLLALLLTLRLQNILAKDGGETGIYATAFLTLKAGEETVTVTCEEQTTTMKDTLQTVNGLWAELSEEQQTAVKALCDQYIGTVSGWELTNIYPATEESASAA